MRLRAAYTGTWIALLTATGASHAATIRVDASGPVATVREAIERASAGDTIVVMPGTYSEHGLIIAKPLTLTGTDMPVLDAGGAGTLFEITAPNVTVSGLVMRGVPTSFTREPAAIRLANTRGCEIRDNLFENDFYAVYAAHSEHCRIVDNRMVGDAPSATVAGNGIHLWYCRDITVSGNAIRGHRDGIYLEFVRHSRIERNSSERNWRYGLHFMFSDSCSYEGNRFVRNGAGVAVMYTTQVEMKENAFIDNWGAASYGLLLKEIRDSRIVGNAFTGNSIGIYMEGADRTRIENNLLCSNGWALKIMANCLDSRVEGNDFIDNSFQVATNSRQSFSVFRQNYWSTYSGYDLDRDGFGDEPYRPVSLYSRLVEVEPTSLILVRSLLVDVLNLAEHVVPTLTPAALVDAQPRMRPLR
jgi:nitrous oxidase accessory protein